MKSMAKHTDFRAVQMAFVVALVVVATPCKADVWAQQSKLLPNPGQASQLFGKSIGLFDDTAIIGALYDDGASEKSGSAYVFVHSGTGWTQQTRLVPSNGAAYHKFGASVAISGETALVSAIRDNTPDSQTGTVYVYERNGDVWTEQTELLPKNGTNGDYFGSYLALSGNTALVGAITDKEGIGIGAAYIFVRNGAVWTQQAKLFAGDGAAHRQFGNAVAISGDTALVGAPYDAQGMYSGAAYVFVRNGDVWTQQAQLVPGDDAALFGLHVALSGDTALVGAPYSDDNGTDSGAAYVFRRNGSNWTQEAKLLASDGEADDLFGTSVALSGDTAFVGAIGNDDSGAAYVFMRNGGAWTAQTKLVASGGVRGMHFGDSIAISTDMALVGAPNDDDNGYRSGSAYFFALGEGNGGTPADPSNGNGCTCHVTGARSRDDAMNCVMLLCLGSSLWVVRRRTGFLPIRRARDADR